MKDYNYLGIPININDELTVLMSNMQYRTCIRKPYLDHFSLWFTDCMYPAQNAYVNQNDIVKWKIKRD